LGNPADRWSFNLLAPTVVTIDLSSVAFDTVVCLFNSSNQFLALDNDSGAGTNSRLTASLTTGSYFIEATTRSPGGTVGVYTLSLQSGFSPGKPLGLGQILAGNLYAGGANSNCDLGNAAVRYAFSLAAPTVLTMDLSSTAFDTVVCLYNSSNQFLALDDNSGPGTNSRLTTSLTTGSYFIEVTTRSPGGTGGPYTLSLQPGVPPGTPISVGQTLLGNLSSVTAKANCSFRNSADRYHFTLSAPATVTIGLSSAAFDTYVCLYNSVDQFLASDDNSGGGTNSRLVQSLLAGDYYIEVTTVSPGGAGGAYSLSLQ
jgi:hypothetical protein